MLPLRTIVLASATCLAVLVPAQADAGGYTRTDPAKDVVTQKDDGPEVRAPNRAEGDVTSSSVRHLPRRVLVTLQFAELTQTPDLASHVFRIRTNERLLRDITLSAGQGNWAGSVTMTKASGRTVRCRIGSAINYTGNRAAVSIPRRCLSRPRWVRVGSGSVSVEGSSFYADDSLTNGVLRHNPTLGPKVFRG